MRSRNKEPRNFELAKMMTRRGRNSGSRIPSGYSMSCHARLKRRELTGNSSKRNSRRSTLFKGSLTRREKNS
ncbi:hypothetical protein EPI10_005644 [Gossypium australe]|uniref:Uncharacterized protein n=1 Tax=Gossypium australe TaxID=47621 RepID=A0A5B6WQ05_9ROSI|nr:hypothetical protein EPI10_005644 [Gossypium australe]